MIIIQKYKINISLLLVLLVLLVNGVQAGENNLRKIMDISGRWKFSIGDKDSWSARDFDDSNWEEIIVPEKWENQGFYGYDGFAWYRKTFRFNSKVTQLPFYLSLGYIDDVDEVYFNGELIGKTGSMPPFYATAYNARRVYRIPQSLIKTEGENSIAVRIFDEGGEGGIVHGDIAILMDVEAIPVDLSLQGIWKFKTNDCKIVENGLCDFSEWNDIIVPGYWEDQGYKHYDGIACYAIKFKLDNEFKGEDMVIVLGKIDDIDQVYLNGNLIGQSGKFSRKGPWGMGNFDGQLRGYYLPKNALKNNAENVFFVRVMDRGGVGGIYEGEIGLITQTNYIKYWNARPNR
jgi:hypothetical protein